MLNCYVRKIETERLILRPITLDDAADMFAYCSDPETIKYLTFKQHESVEASREVIAKFFLERPQNGVPEAYAIVLKKNGKMIGTGRCSFGSLWGCRGDRLCAQLGVLESRLDERSIAKCTSGLV